MAIVMRSACLSSSVPHVRPRPAAGFVKSMPHHQARRAVKVQANALHVGQYVIAEVAKEVAKKASEAAPGSVDAPVWVIVAGAIVVTVGLSASGFLLQPGVEASEKMQTRDKKKWNKYD